MREEKRKRKKKKEEEERFRKSYHLLPDPI
jgi:hypothetical protein